MSYDTGHDLLAALRIAVNHDHRRRQRKARVAVAAGTLVLLIGATAAAANAPWWKSSKPEIAKATLLVETTLRYPYNGIAAGTKIALWQAPDQSGGSCLVISRSGTLHWGARSHPAQCRQSGTFQATGHPLSVSVGSALSRGLYDHLLQGSVNPKSGIVKVALQQPNGATTLALHHGWFLGDARPTKTLDFPNAYVIGFNSSGHEVARVRLPAR